MRRVHLTKQERQIILWLRLLVASFALVGFVFLFNPNYFLNYVDRVGLVFFNFHSQVLPDPTYEIWWILTLALMGVLFYATLLAQQNWLRYHILVPTIIISHLISGVGFLGLAIFHSTHFFYIVASVTDIIICGITAYAYSQAIQSRAYSKVH